MASVMEGMSEAQASFKDLKLSWILIQGEIDFLVHVREVYDIWIATGGSGMPPGFAFWGQDAALLL